MTKVIIKPTDKDWIVVSGASPTTVVDTNARFNVRLPLGATNLDEAKFVRYFPKSGTYRVKFIYRSRPDTGILDIGLDSPAGTNLWNQFDFYDATGFYNQETFTTKDISRGQHDISFKINGKNGSSSGYNAQIQLMEFTLIDEHPVLGAEGKTKASDISWEEIGRKKIHQDETGTAISVKFNPKRFLRIEVSGILSVSNEARFLFNNDDSGTDQTSGNYALRKNANGGTDDVTSEQDRDHGILAINDTDPFFSVIEVVNILDEEKLAIVHTVVAGVAGAGSSPQRDEHVVKWDNITSLVNEFNLTSESGTYVDGSEVVVFGHD